MLQPKDLSYSGFFRLPLLPGPGEQDRLAFGASTIAYNPKRNSLYVSTIYQNVGEVGIPGLRFKAPAIPAKLIHPPADITGGLKPKYQDPETKEWAQFKLGGLLVDGEKIYWNFFKFYNVQPTNHPHLGESNNDLSNLQAKGPYQTTRGHIQTTGGYLASVPATWRQAFGVPRICGLSRPQGRASSSNGPAVFGSDEFTAAGTAPITKTFLFHPDTNRLTYWLNTKEGTPFRQTWKGVDEFNGFVFTETSLIAGMLLARTTTDDYGEHGKGYRSCQDGIQGYHGKFFVPELWFYNPDRLLTVAAGTIKPWQPRPYARLDLSKYWLNKGPCKKMGGFTWDEKGKRLFVVELDADLVSNPAEPNPVVHVFKY